MIFEILQNFYFWFRSLLGTLLNVWRLWDDSQKNGWMIISKMTITQRLKQLLVYETLNDSQKESMQDTINSDGWLWKDRMMKLNTGETQTRISKCASFMIQTNHMVADHVIDEMMTMKIWVSSRKSHFSKKVAIFDKKKVATLNKKKATLNKKSGNFEQKKRQLWTKKAAVFNKKVATFNKKVLIFDKKVATLNKRSDNF